MISFFWVLREKPIPSIMHFPGVFNAVPGMLLSIFTEVDQCFFYTEQRLGVHVSADKMKASLGRRCWHNESWSRSQTFGKQKVSPLYAPALTDGTHSPHGISEQGFQHRSLCVCMPPSPQWSRAAHQFLFTTQLPAHAPSWGANTGNGDASRWYSRKGSSEVKA